MKHKTFLILVLLISLVPSVYSSIEYTYSDIDFDIGGAGPPVTPPISPGPLGGGGGAAPGEGKPICGDGTIQLGETCEICPEDYETVYGLDYCEKIRESMLLEFNLTILVDPEPAQLVIKRGINSTVVVYDGNVSYGDSFILKEDHYHLRISKKNFVSWGTSFYLNDDKTIKTVLNVAFVPFKIFDDNLVYILITICIVIFALALKLVKA